ncbi:MAG: hypothetical protein V2J55_10965 [Candidatus Competibacteraceae bacterium]|jgi:hypothetical protein|nr:hypothetical protein [Candidatus Competibacteraceae bacterium]
MKSPDIDLNHIAQRLDTLQGSPARNKRQTVNALLKPIQTALERGCKYDEIVACLAEEGISIHANTLRSYVKDLTAGSNNESGKGQSQQSSPAVKTASSAHANPAKSASQPATTRQKTPLKKPVTLSGSGTFTPAPEVPLEELLRRAQEEDEAAEAKAGTNNEAQH